MKYRGLLVFAIALFTTWCWTVSQNAISLQTHTIIQTRLMEIIQQAVLNHRPDTEEIVFDRLWTEPKNDDRIVATYDYRFTTSDGSVESISGQATIQRLEGDSWVVGKVFNKQNSISFGEGTVIRAGQ
jgi:hypothetical protein